MTRRRTPFTIRLNYQTGENKQELNLCIDTGSSKIGSAVVDNSGNVLYMSQIEVRNDITRKIMRRKMYRNTRRSRKTRYRPIRFLNRRNSIRNNRYSPTLVSKIDSHVKEIKFVKNLLPISRLYLETASFDPHALKNPNVLIDKSLYQKGDLYGYANVKAFVLHRDDHTCQHCLGKSKDERLNVHHIQHKSQGGSNSPDNLITLCEICHKDHHSDKIELKIKKKKQKNLKHATQMNVICAVLRRKYSEAIETFGYITKTNRELFGLPKTHYFDAVSIKYNSKIKFKTKMVLFKKCVAAGEYRRTMGGRSEKRMPKGKIFEFNRYDKVKYKNQIYFISGRYSTGYVILVDIYGDNKKMKPMPKIPKLVRISSRKTWLMDEIIECQMQ